MSEPVLLYLDINPEPWAVGPLGVGKKQGKMYPYMGRNQSVHAYKEAVRDILSDMPLVQVQEPGEYGFKLTIFVWRRLEGYVGETGRGARAHQADATNIQKATEDALQGILFENDRDVRDVRTIIVEQGHDVEPGLGVLLETLEIDSQIPAQMSTERLLAITRAAKPPVNDNAWGGPE